MADFITLYADASWCDKAKVAGWAVWIKNSNGTKTEASGYEREVDNSGIAEMLAIYKGLEIIRNRLCPSYHIIVVVTDCQAALDNIQGRYSKSIYPFQRMAEAIHALVPETCSLRVNKVKGHSTHDGARSHVNGLVDKAARKQLRVARDNILRGVFQ